MQKLTIVFAVFIAASFAVDQEVVDRINSVQSTWKAGHNRITEMGDDYKMLLGALVPENVTDRRTIETNDVIPESFDAREKWPHCQSISAIKNQGQCGSCWAVAVTSAASDRLCIASNGKVKVDLSALQVLSCCEACLPYYTTGCNGGYANGAWDYLKSTGVVTGGDFGSNEGCQPYSVPPTLTANDLYTPPCQLKCTNRKYKKSFQKDKHIGSDSYFVDSNVEDIQSEIIKNGPVEATFSVYEDFKNYQSGVYVHTTQAFEGNHAIRILGWGVENGVDYWLIANSWGDTWGDNGLFKIKRGTNECGIEEYVTAGLINK